MKGLVIWASCECRSVMATYRALFRELKCPGLVVFMRQSDIRQQTGFRADEFGDMQRCSLTGGVQQGHEIIEGHPGWFHIFCEYQNDALCRSLLKYAKWHGASIGILSESPCNMSAGVKRFLKKIYLKMLLPYKIRGVVARADFFVNCSGDDSGAERIGWPRQKIIPFGYFPPSIEGSHCVLRKAGAPLEILATGILSRYRGADVLVEALAILKSWHVPYHATITQTGALFDELQRKAKSLDLPIAFPGRVSIDELVRLYESCSVYVGAGRDEPWGMRLNDALNCGAPLLVSEGMGGAKLVRDYVCGSSFVRGDALGMAYELRRFVEDKDFYRSCAEGAVKAAAQCSPEAKAKWLVNELARFGWA